MSMYGDDSYGNEKNHIYDHMKYFLEKSSDLRITANSSKCDRVREGAEMSEPNYDVIEVLLDLRRKVIEIPTHRDHFYPRDIHNYKGDVLEMIDRKIREQE